MGPGTDLTQELKSADDLSEQNTAQVLNIEKNSEPSILRMRIRLEEMLFVCGIHVIRPNEVFSHGRSRSS